MEVEREAARGRVQAVTAAPSVSTDERDRTRAAHARLLALHRRVGNAAVTRLVRGGDPATTHRTLPPPAARAVTSEPVVARQEPAEDEAAEETHRPVILVGSPEQLVTELIAQLRAALPDANLGNLLTAVLTSRRMHLYRGERRVAVLDLDPERTAPLPSGIFRPGAGGTVRQLVEHGETGARTWRGVGVEDPERRYVDAIVESQRERYREALRGATDLVLLRSGGQDTAGPREEGAGEGGEGEGEGGEAARPVPRWAWRLFGLLQDRLQAETRRVRELAVRGAGEADQEALARLREAAAVPDRLLLGADGDDTLLMVRIASHRGALALREDQSVDLVWERVQALTRALLAGRRPSRNASVDELALGLAEGEAADPAHVAANTEAYPSEIRNLGPGTGISGATHRFSMHLDWSVEGRWGTLAAFGPRRYQWDILRLRTAAGGLAGRGDARRSGRGEAAGAELGRGFGEIGEDVEATVEEEILDPVTASVIATDAGVRSVATLVSSFVTLASQPSNEQGVGGRGRGPTWCAASAPAHPSNARTPRRIRWYGPRASPFTRSAS